MTHPLHRHDHAHDHPQGMASSHGDDSGLAALLNLDAQVLGGYLERATAWAQEYVQDSPRTILDVGAGTGTGSLALARRFPCADVVALDRSPSMLGRITAASLREGLGDRVTVVQADLDVAWPQVRSVDLAWAASSLHEVADPDRVLRDLRNALRPGGLLVVLELDALPRFLPDDIGLGRPGVERRCHEVLAQAGWNAHPDWQPHLARAGLDLVARRTFDADVDAAGASTQAATAQYAQAYLSRIRPALDGRLDDDDLGTLELLLAEGGPHSILRRGDLTLRSSRTAWAARRP